MSAAPPPVRFRNAALPRPALWPHARGVMDAPDASTGGEITRMLAALRDGEAREGEPVVAALYAELRQIARARMRLEPPGHTLQPTALVHEAWLRLGGGVFANRAHFFAAAAEAMRRILVERARRKQAGKRGGGAEHLDVQALEIACPMGGQEEALAVHDALERLAAQDSRKAEVVKLRYFAGLTFEQVADALAISTATANREWAFARAWLHREIAGGRAA